MNTFLIYLHIKNPPVLSGHMGAFGFYARHLMTKLPDYWMSAKTVRSFKSGLKTCLITVALNITSF